MGRARAAVAPKEAQLMPVTVLISSRSYMDRPEARVSSKRAKISSNAMSVSTTRERLWVQQLTNPLCSRKGAALDAAGAPNDANTAAMTKERATQVVLS